MYFNCMYTTPSAVCLCDNIGLVSLILLGWELHVSYITVVCVQGIPILSPLLFMPSLYSTFYLYYEHFLLVGVSCNYILNSGLSCFSLYVTLLLCRHYAMVSLLWWFYFVPRPFHHIFTHYTCTKRSECLEDIPKQLAGSHMCMLVSYIKWSVEEWWVSTMDFQLSLQLGICHFKKLLSYMYNAHLTKKHCEILL